MESLRSVSPSGARQHHEGGAERGKLFHQRGPEPPLQTEDPDLHGRRGEGTKLDWQHQDAVSVQGEVRRRGVPLHGNGEVRRGLDGLRSAVQGLPAGV